MAMPTRVPVQERDVFPHGAYAFIATKPEPERDFDKSTREQFVQARDKHTELPVWTLEVLDADPETRKNEAAITVRVISEYPPVLPDAPSGWPVRPISFEGLTGTPYVDQARCKPGELPHRCRARLAWSYRATGVKAPDYSSTGQASGSAGSGSKSTSTAAKKEAA